MRDFLENESPAITRGFTAKPEPQPQPQPEMVVLPKVKPGKPGWDVRAYTYVRGVMTMMVVKGVWRVVGHLSATVIRWLFYQAWRLYSLVKWRLSRRIGTMAYDKRQQACAACEGLVKVGDKRFCGPCGCRHWKWADLRIKNEREEHNCPWAKHDGSYQTKGGCSSCSGGPKSNGKQTAPQARR